MSVENDIVEDNPGDAVEIETPEAPQVERPGRLSRRDALEVAIKTHREGEPELKAEPVVESPPVAKVAEVAKPKEPPPLEPPAEYTAEAKEAFRKAPREVQQEIQRLHRSNREWYSAKTEEVRAVRELASALDPYAKAQGLKEPTEAALKKAIDMYLAFENAADPKAAAAEYLRAKGLEPPAEWEKTEAVAPHPEISQLRKELDGIKQTQAQREQAERAATLNSIWSAFSGAKNQAGTPRFPDIQGDTAEALRLSQQVLALVGGYGDTPLAIDFISRVRAVNPAATPFDILEEAYRYCRGKIDDTAIPPPKEDPKHLTRSNRAAMSVPGRGSSAVNGRGQKTFSDAREARRFAVQLLREKQGH